MTRVKVCGLRELEHMITAARAGADLVGLVFVLGVRRQVGPTQARELVSAFRQALGGNAPKVVGLFADQPLAEVNETARFVGLDFVQLCGREDMAFCRRVQRRVLKVLHVRGDVPAAQEVERLEGHLTALAAAGCLAVLDRYSARQPGGLGQPFDWAVACALATRGHRFLLAGGLTPENVAEAIRVVQPYGVDVSSGVETDGVKDEAKIKAFVRAAKEAA